MLPASWLTVPYNWVTGIMRKNLKEQQTSTTEITTKDFHLTKDNLDYTWDIFLTAHKQY
jgi:hypothetical protein